LGIFDPPIPVTACTGDASACLYNYGPTKISSTTPTFTETEFCGTNDTGGIEYVSGPTKILLLPIETLTGPFEAFGIMTTSLEEAVDPFGKIILNDPGKAAKVLLATIAITVGEGGDGDVL